MTHVRGQGGVSLGCSSRLPRHLPPGPGAADSAEALGAAELAQLLFSWPPVRGQVRNTPGASGELRACAGHSRQRSPPRHFTNHTPTGCLTNPVTRREFWLSDTAVVLTMSVLMVYLNP